MIEKGLGLNMVVEERMLTALSSTVDMYRQKIAKQIEDDEKGMQISEFPVFDLRRARREFQEKWGPKEEWGPKEGEM